MITLIVNNGYILGAKNRVERLWSSSYCHLGCKFNGFISECLLLLENSLIVLLFVRN